MSVAVQRIAKLDLAQLTIISFGTGTLAFNLINANLGLNASSLTLVLGVAELPEPITLANANLVNALSVVVAKVGASR